MSPRKVYWIEIGITALVFLILGWFITTTVTYRHYENACRYEVEESLTQLWAGKVDSVRYGKMVIQRVKGNEVIVDRIGYGIPGRDGSKDTTPIHKGRR